MHFEEFHVGQRFVTATWRVSREDIIAFAEDWDPQHLHLEGPRPDDVLFDDVIASGYHTIVIAWRQWIDLDVQGEEGRAGTQMQDVRWLRPVWPDDELTTTVTIEDQRLTRRGRGLLEFLFEVRNGDGELVLTFRNSGLQARRDGDSPEEAPAS